MKRLPVVLATLLVVFMFLGADIESALENPRINQSNSDDGSPLRSGEDLVRRALAWSGPPKAPVSLKELVSELQLVTPPANQTDTDGDGLWDIIELVIATDFNDTDSDSDNLNDTFEVFNDLDPLAADSNGDGLPDNHEIMNVASLDVDDDGVPNAWDFDNDNDGIGDEVDVSPNAKTSIGTAFDIDIASDGKPLYISLQLVPENPEHVRLFDQWWDWPTDSEDRMQDLDGSKKDVRVIPSLKLTTNLSLDPVSIEGYPITVTSDGLVVALSPVYELRNAVAFETRLYIPESTAVSFSLRAELFWRVVGYTDILAQCLMGDNDMYISSCSNGLAVANATDVFSSCAVQLVNLDDETVALRMIGGGYLSVAESGLLYFNGTGIGTSESFTRKDISPNQITLRSAETGKYVAIGTDGLLVANSTSEDAFQLTNLGAIPEPITLAVYDDSFMFSGISVQESYYSNMGLYYSDNHNETIAAQTLLTYDFLRNCTTTLWDIPNLLAGHEISLMYQNQTFPGLDQAYLSLSNRLLPAALDALPPSKELPVIIATEDLIKIAELSEAISGSYVGGQSLAFDLESLETSLVKSMSCYVYNTTTYEALTPEQVMFAIAGWGYDDTTALALMALMHRFSAGESIINKEGLVGVEFELPSVSLLSSSAAFAKGMASTFGDDVLRGVGKALGRLIKGINSIMAPSTVEAANIARQASNTAKAATRTQKVVGFLKSNWLALLCIAVDVGLSIWAAVAIANAVGGRLGREIGATYGVVASIIGLTTGILLLVLAVQGPTGAFIAAIISLLMLLADLIGGFMSKAVEILTTLIFGSPHQESQTHPSTSVSWLDLKLSDNTLSVGDRITVFCSLWGNVTGYGHSQQYWVDRSSNTPWITIDEPSGSNSETGHSYTLVNSLSEWLPEAYRTAREYNCSAWIEPGLPQPNFPVAVRLHSDYTVWNVWYHRIMGMFKCTHEDRIVDSSSYVYTRYYFDVMPASLDDFVQWRSIHAIDSDMDGLNNTMEIGSGVSSPWAYDTDGEGLNDAFEVNIGSNPEKYDSDGDGLTDYYENIYGTNATNMDSDGDGLFDYLEIAGWQIGFNYTGNSSLPFEILVTSNPWLADSDGDGIGDLDEYYSQTNPRSADTNGDGTPDEPLPRIESHPVLEAGVTLGSGIWLLFRPVMTVSDQGYIYLSSRDDGILRYFTNLTAAPLPPESLFPSLAGHSTQAIAVDNANEWLYEINYVFDTTGHHTLYRYSLDGTIMNPGSWTPFEIQNCMDIDIGADSSIYAARWWDIQKYSSTGTLLNTWGSYGSADDEFEGIGRIVADSTNGLLYVTDSPGGDFPIYRVVRRDATDGSYLGTLPKDSMASMGEVAVDANGYLYAAVTQYPEGPIFLSKFDRNGMEDVGFRFNLTAEFGISGVRALCVDQEQNIYILWFDSDTAEHILSKFSQEIALVDPCLTDDNPDWDDDGLTNQQEIGGWEVTVDFNETLSLMFNVTSDPRLSDTDGDHLSDYLEYNLTSNPQSPDTDADGVSDHKEWWMSMHPGEVYVAPLVHPQYLAPGIGFVPADMPSTMNLTNWDSDGDLLGDGAELTFGSDPTLQDSDSDTLSDLLEFQLNSDPNKIDTDDDGATDAEEYAGNSSLLVADSDGDFAFDGAEYDNGTSPLNPDMDGDGLVDGDEALFETDPLLGDSDGDNVSDWLEVQLWLNPLNNDTDNDAVPDGTELEWGSNPLNGDSDWDGVPDGEDPDTFVTWAGLIILAYDPDTQNNTLHFAEKLQEYATVITVSVEELMASYTEYQYIVLVGRPDVESNTVAGLTYSLLEDTGAVLDEMSASGSHEVAVRHGYWADPQTIVILSEAYESDVYTVLQILRGRNISVLPDSAYVEYQTEPLTDNATYAYAIEVNEIDTLRATDTILGIALDDPATPSVLIQRYNTGTTPHQLTSVTGLVENDIALGKYVEMTLTFNDASGGALQSAMIQIYYRVSDLDLDGDGSLSTLVDLNESTLCLYWYDEVSDDWVKLSTDLDWVLGVDVNTTDVELYGEHYAGYVWAQVTHLSLFALAAEPLAIEFTYPYGTYLLILLGCVGLVTAIVIYRKRKKSKTKQ